MSFKPSLPYFIFAFFLTFIAQPLASEAGILSMLGKLGKSANKSDGPDIDLSHSVFKDVLTDAPDGSVAEIHHINGQWLAKTPDGTQVPINDFVDKVNGSNTRPTLILTEANLPYSSSAFKNLPSALKVHIHSRRGNRFILNFDSTPPKLSYKNIEFMLTDDTPLSSVLWQLQRPIFSKPPHFIQLSKNNSDALSPPIYGSKISVDKVGIDKLIDSINSLRLETVVISGKIENGFLLQGNNKISVAELQKTASDRDVSLVLLGTDNPKKVLKELSSNWQKASDSGATSFDSIGDFYNRFSPKNATTPLQLSTKNAGEHYSVLYSEKIISKKTVANNTMDSGLSLPLHLIVHSITLLHPDQDHSRELELRIHPAVPSWIQLIIIMSIMAGVLAARTSWFLYKKLWPSPSRETSHNLFSFYFTSLVRWLCFVLFYLPLLGLFSPIYLILKWTFSLINFVLIRPSRWLLAKLR